MAPGASASPLTFSRSAVFKKAGSWSWDTLTSPAYMNSNIAWRWLYATSLRIIIGCLDGFSCIQRDWFIHFIKFHYWFKRKGFWHFLVGRKYIERNYREKVQKNHFSLFFFQTFADSLTAMPVLWYVNERNHERITSNKDLKYGLHADKTILWALQVCPSQASVTSVKLFSSRKCLNEVTMFDWKSFHLRKNCCCSPAIFF